jgi:alpha-1,3-fucosyltransferase
LAGFLKILDEDDELYNEYFWWKDYYSEEYSSEDISRHGFCYLCQKLHEQENNDIQTYPDLDLEWGDGNKCDPFYPTWI